MLRWWWLWLFCLPPVWLDLDNGGGGWWGASESIIWLPTFVLNVEYFVAVQFFKLHLVSKYKKCILIGSDMLGLTDVLLLLLLLLLLLVMRAATFWGDEERGESVASDDVNVDEFMASRLRMVFDPPFMLLLLLLLLTGDVLLANTPGGVFMPWLCCCCCWLFVACKLSETGSCNPLPLLLLLLLMMLMSLLTSFTTLFVSQLWIFWIK